MKKSFMRSKYYNIFRIPLLILMDATIIFFSVLIANMISQRVTLIEIFNGTAEMNWIQTILLIVFQILVFAIFKIYLIFTRYLTGKDALKIMLLTIIYNIVFWSISALITHTEISNLVLFVIVVFEVMLLLIPRLWKRMLVSLSGMKKVEAKTNRTLIYGAGEGGRLVLEEMLQNDDLTYLPIGFIDDDESKVGRYTSGYKVLGTSSELDEIIAKKKIETIVVSISNLTKKEFKELYEKLTKYPVQVKKIRVINDGLEKGNIVDVDIKDLLNRGEVKLDQKELASYLSNKVVLVTGAGGSIGSELCRQISLFEPSHIVMLDINENGLYMLEQEFNRKRMHGKLSDQVRITTVIASIRDKKAIDEVIKKYHPTAVFHAAAHKHVPLMETRPMEAIKNNVFGTRNVILSCIEHKVERFIMISTDKAVNPTNVMGATKRMTEMILQAYGDNGVTKLAAVRFGNVLGSNGSVIPIFKKQIEEGGPVTITDKKIIRYFMTIPEAAQLVLQAGYYADQGNIFVLDMGEPVKIIDLAEKMIRLSGLEPYKDIEIKEIGLRPGEKMFEELRLGNETRHKTKNDLIFVNEKMEMPLDVINQKLEYLQAALDKHLDKEYYREVMLKIIQDNLSLGM